MHAPVSIAGAGGGQTFNYYFKKFLKEDKFDIRLVSCGEHKEKDIVEKELSEIKHHVIYWNDPNESKLRKVQNIESRFNLFNKHANMISNADAREIVKVAFSYKEEGYIPDIVIFEWTNTLMLLPEIKKIFPEAHFVASEHDVTFVGYRRKSKYYKGIRGLLWRLKYKVEKDKEISALKKCDLILPHNSDNKVILVDEGMDEKKILGLVPYFKEMTKQKRNSNYTDILFFGAMNRDENVLSAIWFVDKVMPRIKDLNVRFVILGNKPTEAIRRMESDKVHITGFVDSIEPYFEKSMCLVAPLVLGAGIKIKILEALTSGIPVLTNDIGIEGIPAVHARDYFHCETPEEYENIIRKICNREIDEQSIESNAKKLMETTFSKEYSFNMYKKRLIEICGGNET